MRREGFLVFGRFFPLVERVFAWLKRFFAKRRRYRLGGVRGATSETGREGEGLARAHLERLGYRILAANWRAPRDRRDELDLVALDGEGLVFVEVKTRAADALVSGRYAVDARKKRALRRAAYAYLSGLECPPRSVRFDVVEVALQKSSGGGNAAEPVVRHFKAMPLFPKTLRLRRGESIRAD